MAAPKGNLYALGNNGGRPPKYESAEELQKRIEQYFDSLLPEPRDDYQSNDGEEIEAQQPSATPPTITGLALFLGFCDKQSLYDYKKKEEFSFPVKRALSVIENHYEMSLNNKTPTGSIFALKNMQWSDKTEVEHSGEVAMPAFEWGKKKE